MGRQRQSLGIETRCLPTIFGITVERTLAIDELHVIYLGVMLAFCKMVLWIFLMSDVWGGPGLEANRLAFAHRLRRWYRARHRLYPFENLTRVTNVTIHMIGDQYDQKLKTKAAETFGILLFLIDELLRVNDEIVEHRTCLLAAAQALLKLCQIWKSASWKMTGTQLSAAFSAMLTFLHLTSTFQQLHLPKRHLLLHFVQRCARWGCLPAY